MNRDAALRDDVLKQIRSNPLIASRDIAANAGDSLVTLTGFVDTYAEKYAAEKAAQSVYGVAAIANDIAVKPLDGQTDPEIARDIIHAMKMDAAVPDDRITVIVTDGIVRLNGTVERDFQRRAAEACVRNISGVSGILNTLSLEVGTDPADMPGGIKEGLFRSADLQEMRQMPQAG